MTVVEPLYSPGYFHDPYPRLTQVREAGPVHHVKRPDGLEVWLITRYAEARAALADHRLSMDGHRIQQALGAFAYGYLDPENDAPHTLLSSDPPDHTRLRRFVNRAFTSRRISGLRPRVQAIVDALLDKLEGQETADLIETFATPVPMEVICELLGVPVADAEDFKDWTAALFLPPSGKEQDPATEAMRNLRAYLTRLIADKRAARDAGTEDDDLTTALIGVRDGDDDQLSEHELVSMIVQLLIAGHETTVNGIGNGVFNLLSHPDQLAALRRDPTLITTAVDELLRYDGPLETAILRIATEDIPIGDQVVPAGAFVKIVLASANRDPAHFTDPDRLLLDRKENRHIQFGHSVHNCLGAHLARTEMEIAIGSLLTRFPGLRLAVPADEVPWREIMIMRSLARLPVALGDPAV
ncbi:cytochrome P450 [Streptomyces roseirectus]|uniref:Cytochrome P450 n=1 Tax=Streptomyces roseirectus TaxID=2768066 RepID=A0A7H0IPZ6_9ACTN|nr:cytochrome P450 [Streptomyces roseirectus]QNP74862.1 cytochrome P450 [Streptomyces roseirectus]